MLFARHLPARDSDASPLPPSSPAGLGPPFQVRAARRPPGPSWANPRGSSTMQALLSRMCLGRRSPLSGLVGAPTGASDLLGRAPRHSASEAGFSSAPGATKALAPQVARPAVCPTGPAALGYDAGDDTTTSRPLGCMRPWSSSVGRGARGEIILIHRTLWSFPWPEPWHLSLRHFRRTHAASPVARDECGRRVTRVPRRAQPWYIPRPLPVLVRA